MCNACCWMCFRDPCRQDIRVTTPARDAAPPRVARRTATAPATEAASPGVNDLIVIDDTPLLDAIRNLARTAGLNIMIDPRVSFGQPGPDGKPVPQPTVSIRWEKVTAEQALIALLNNYFAWSNTWMDNVAAW